jgi:hypothetical protein
MEKLVGLQKRSTVCKICNSFTDEMLNQITLDLLLERKSYNKIVQVYTPFLPRDVSALNHMNLSAHKKHCDPKLIAEAYLREHGEPVTPAESLMYVFSDGFLKELDRKRLLTEMYKTRLKNLETLQRILDEKINILNSLPIINPNDTPAEVEALILRREALISDIKSSAKQIDVIMTSLQDVVVKELNNDKGLIQAQQTINVNFIQNVQVHMQNFLGELVPFILTDMFKDNPEDGKRLLGFISQTMDKHLAPALDETKLLQQVNPR